MKKRTVIHEYFEARPILLHIRIMERVMKAIEDDPKTSAFHPRIHCAYLDILSEELAPYALTLALAIVELEDAYPEIKRRRS